MNVDHAGGEGERFVQMLLLSICRPVGLSAACTAISLQCFLPVIDGVELSICGAGGQNYQRIKRRTWWPEIRHRCIKGQWPA
jgi:hypothetical protein